VCSPRARNFRCGAEQVKDRRACDRIGLQGEPDRYRRKDGAKFWASVLVDAIRRNDQLVEFAAGQRARSALLLADAIALSIRADSDTLAIAGTLQWDASETLNLSLSCSLCSMTAGGAPRGKQRERPIRLREMRRSAAAILACAFTRRVLRLLSPPPLRNKRRAFPLLKRGKETS